MKQAKLENRDIIESCVRGDADAFRILVDRYADFAFSVAFRIINDEEESKDIVQESFISAWSKIGSFNMEKNFTNWLYRIIVNKSLDLLRRRKRVSFVHPDAHSWNLPGLYSESDPGQTMDNDGIGRMIRLLTEKLSPKQKIVFILSELQGLGHDEISQITGLEKTAIKSNLNHARRNIGKSIKKYF